MAVSKKLPTLAIIALMVIAHSSISEAEYGAKEGMGEGEKGEGVTVEIKATLEEAPLIGEVIIRQKRYADGSSGMAWIKVFVDKIRDVEITSVNISKSIITDNSCPDNLSEMEAVPLTKFFATNGSMEETEGTSDTVMIQNEWDKLEDFDVTEGIQRALVLNVDGEDKCFPFMLQESDDIRVIEVKFAKCEDYSSSALIEVISKRIGINKSMIADIPLLANRSAVVMNGCSKAKIAFISEFEKGEQVRKLFLALSSSDELGRFSKTKNCYTNVKDSFITDMIIKAYVEREEATCPKDAGKGSPKYPETYERLVEQYKEMLGSYKEKYGAALGIEDKGSERPRRPMIDWQGDKKGQDNSRDSEDLAFYKLANYIGMPKNTERLQKEEEISKLISSGILGSSKKTKFENLQKELEMIMIQEADTRERTYYGLCLVSLRGEGNLEKLKEIKGKLDDADDWGVEGDNILRKLLVEGIKYNKEKLSSFKDIVKRILGLSSDYPALALSKKLLLGFGIQSEYNQIYFNDNQKQRVLLKLERIKTFMENVNTVAMDGDSEELKAFVGAVAAFFSEEKAKDSAKEVFMRMLFPELYEDDSTLADSVNGLLSALSEADMQKLENRTSSFLMYANIDTLMLLNIALAKADSLDGDCGLTDLAKKIPDEDKAREGETYEDGVMQYRSRPRQSCGDRRADGRQRNYNRRTERRGNGNQRPYRDAGSGRYTRRQSRDQRGSYYGNDEYSYNAEDSYVRAQPYEELPYESGDSWMYDELYYPYN